ncbi:putative nuclear pore complex protein [Apostichopus japonicus]|uniref:Putative nuclear pore complex protein n=1 Tax=Stichopus japonicus TaxID=307972 RepID=A0A2G8KR80_STIJA|nr:putative nuclear pore complex protein [Apostichopus japonicus]
MAGDLLPPSLYVPYLEMLRGLSNGKQSASCCFNLLKMNGTGGGGGGSVRSVSWDHFFGSFNRYFSSLRQDMRPESPFQDPNRTPTGYNKGITPQELDGLIAVLKLTQTVASWSEEARIQLYENQSWLPTILLFGLLTCSVPLQLKAECLKTLAVFAKSPEVVMSLWQALETSQVRHDFGDSIWLANCDGRSLRSEKLHRKSVERNTVGPTLSSSYSVSVT